MSCFKYKILFMTANKKIVFFSLAAAVAVTIVIVSCEKDLNKTDPNVVGVDQYFTALIAMVMK